MKHIKPINEFFGPFKKKSEDDKIALDFLKRIKKVNPENNPYDIKKLSNNEMRSSRKWSKDTSALSCLYNNI